MTDRPRSAVVVASPYEATASFVPGCAFGPAAAAEVWERIESSGLEPPWPQAPIESWIEAHPRWETSPDRMREAVRRRVADVRAAGRLPLLVGGEHTVTAGALDALDDPGSIAVVQFDAHADLRDAYEESPWNHACVMRRALDRGHPLVQIGIRSACREELREVYGTVPDGRIERLERPAGAGRPSAVLLTRSGLRRRGVDSLLPAIGPRIYVTIDLDALDPSCAPGVGTPEPDGLSWFALQGALDAVLAGRELVGADVVELCPARDDGRTAVATVRLLRRLAVAAPATAARG
jgi:agmatinase